ncbi:MAG: octaprenyl diphosphate synthase [Vibrionaceae bacterium]
MNFKKIQALAADDMAKVNREILAQLDSEVALIGQLGVYIISNGGKRMRPLLTILSAKALNYQGDEHITAAAFIELIHTATLLHDDVVDESALRRGKQTANALFGNAASVLVGDFIYTRSFQMMAQLNSLPILKLMSESTNVIAKGEVMQLMNCNNPQLSEQTYLEVIYSKTARLFEVATQISALLTRAPSHIEQALQDYGRYLGTAFQLTDDLMDYTASDAQMGKQAGDDLAEGKATLPLLHAIAHANPQDAQMIQAIIEKGHGRDQMDAVLACLEQTGSLAYTQLRAQQEAEKAILALSVLPESPYKQALHDLALFSVNRNN